MSTESTTPTIEVQYRDIEGFPGYRVGDDGSVWSSRGRYSGGNWVELRATPRHDGRLYVYLIGPAGNRKSLCVSRLVLFAFVGPAPARTIACHNDGDASNNFPSNLRWDTHKANMADARRHGTLAVGSKHGRATKPECTLRGEAHQNSKLTATQVISMRQEFAAGVSNAELAKKHKVSNATSLNAIKRKTWTHVP